MSRNLVQFTEEDAAKVMGRPVTEQEYRDLVKVLPFSGFDELFTEAVLSVCDDDKDN